MTSRFTIDCEWANPMGAPIEAAETAGFLEIKLGDQWVTRCDNTFSGSVTNRPLLSAYPLAFWLASSWWRLRWEAGQQRSEPSIDWKLSHVLPAAGGGFVWPALTFESDGESIEISMRPSGQAAYEPLKYLAQHRDWVRANDFELAVSKFVSKVLQRLHERGISRTPLHELWDELTAERANEGASDFRKIEAILGLDPGEAKDEDVQQILHLKASIGEAAGEEIAYASTGSPQSVQVSTLMVKTAQAKAPEGQFLFRHNDLDIGNVMAQNQPWHRGYALAERLRIHCGWKNSVVTDSGLSELLGISPSVLKTTSLRGSEPIPFGVAVRSDPSGKARFVFRSSSHVRRRFDAARMLADHLMAPATDAWLPTTGTHTARQKMQRAFAAEFLCPNRELHAFVNGDTSDYRLEDAAMHFDVAVETVRHQVANHWH